MNIDAGFGKNSIPRLHELAPAAEAGSRKPGIVCRTLYRVTPLGRAKIVTKQGVTVSIHFYYKVDPFAGEKAVTLTSVTVSGQTCINLQIFI